MKKTNESGFTLIELLVVISIIGLLSTMAVISLNSARAKARDAKRVSDIKALSTLIEMERANLAAGTSLTGCTALNASTTLCSTGELSTQAVNFKDPSAGAAAPCGVAPTGVCNYSISRRSAVTVPALVDDYEICTYLESGSGSFAAGPLSVSQGGILNNNCLY